MAPQQLNPAQLNAAARALINARAVKMTQAIYSQTIVPSNQSVINVIPRNVGLIKGFWVKCVATINNGSGVQIDRTDFGPANLLSQIQFNDLNNNTRIQTPGWHVAMLNTIRARRAFGSALVAATGEDSPIGYGANFTAQIAAPSTIAIADATQTNTMWYYVPLAYSENDLRGAVYANVVNATMQLNLTINPAYFVANGSDSTNAGYVGHVAGSVAACAISSLVVTVYQEYLDQLPIGPQGVLLPILDLATIYELKQTVVPNVVAGQDNPYQYANFRDFLSTFLIYVSATAGTRAYGTDINYLALQSANFTNIWKKEPGLVALQTRNNIQLDLPKGLYYFGSREKPISTVQYGNMQLINNPSTANAGAYMNVAVEDFALVQTLSMAGSLPA